jgi:predicted acetyltransferase
MTINEAAVRLAMPRPELKDSFIRASAEFPYDEETLAYERDLAVRDFDRYVRSAQDWARGKHLPRGWIAVSTFWLAEGDEYIGTVNVRHELNEWLLRYGGHIGYGIRPSRRRMGYGKLICKLGLEEARKLGLRRVLITCDADNIGSKNIIESNGGIFENEVPQPDRPVPKRRYWFDL